MASASMKCTLLGGKKQQKKKHICYTKYFIFGKTYKARHLFFFLLLSINNPRGILELHNEGQTKHVTIPIGVILQSPHSHYLLTDQKDDWC